MIKDSKPNSGSPGKMFQKAGKYFSEAEKHVIIQEFLTTDCTKAQIWEKYTGQPEEHGKLLRWMRKLGYEPSVTTRRPNFDTQISSMATKKSNNNHESVSDDFEILQLKNRIYELEQKLKDADMKAIAYATMVDIAEKEFNIPIIKKYNTKP